MMANILFEIPIKLGILIGIYKYLLNISIKLFLQEFLKHLLI
jgi:hypothetical protein